MSPGTIVVRVDGVERIVEGAVLQHDNDHAAVADWNLGAGDVWLSGTREAGRYRIELRSLDEVIAAVTGKETTHDPLADAMLTVLSDRELVRVSLALELDWDTYPAPKTADYRRVQFELVGLVPSQATRSA